MRSFQPLTHRRPAWNWLIARSLALFPFSVRVQILADVVHKAMISEAAQLIGRERSKIVGYLKKHPEIILQLVEWPKAIERLRSVPLQILPSDIDLVFDAAYFATAHGLLTNDAMIVALMHRHGIVHLATNDDDFDRVPGITVWKPR